ncbi:MULTISPECIES: serine hydrolase domain-containing protein [Brenneria]|uniref:Serine hydrolase n=1 Tax=Brenneria nigrifluens DSM 30175 = ATCC 13028 TaxID=1121120 RepID=A0A2U1UCI3_9GAMM|nr:MULTISPECIES: serine hydrolase domain-containing protein [Brenneria]EHD21357.1 beta-lactamase [Brenneria sp. EniD312]PWC19396.1 serine hydrolase [Brenneria nigrifluens] [Brenneria nigrifluens DSM 30175 = ATCC 13028]PWC20110.1 serine hydrolase [Brenneria nigrifluens] [Brenneria nigrifluens DSM 30175 = ATCC 13028]QCR04490.1 serine hydrolase [Brenneria nigrifluens] [Brenneria nigrifluens DSM 30175 = ATCC 13028]
MSQISPPTIDNKAANQNLPARLNAVIDRAIAERRIVGAVVLVRRHGENLFHRAAGLADREAAKPMTEDTLFRLSSVTKPIVATAAMVLVDQGRLDLDEDIRRWLPDFQPRLANGDIPVITPRRLLSHTAGLDYRFQESDDRGPYARAGVSDGLDNADVTLAENLRRLASVPLSFQPGSAWGYSLSMDVLGALIERVCNQPLEEAVRELVTGPLRMDDTDFYCRDAQRLATPYVNDTPLPHRLQEDEIVPFSEESVGVRYSPARALNQRAYPSGGAGMVGTAADVMTLLETLRQGGAPLLAAELVAEMGRDQTGGYAIPDAPGLGFGLGFSVLRDPAAADTPESVGTWRWGGVYGHSWFVDRQQGLSVVALTNTLYEGMSGRFVTELRDAIYR